MWLPSSFSSIQISLFLMEIIHTLHRLKTKITYLSNKLPLAQTFFQTAECTKILYFLITKLSWTRVYTKREELLKTHG